ncbi:MAG: SDR family oxidoreductase [Myxococcota bacterium]|nr:SDR family oxidoreductase [Myxococcota bacterium]
MDKDDDLRVFKGGVAVITGGASGIGLALGRALVRRGCEVILADLQIEEAENQARVLCELGGKATASYLDVTDFSNFQALLQETIERYGRIDYLFNNAGVSIGWDVKDESLNDWNYVIDVNIRGIVNGVHGVYPLMLKQGFGHIINTASGAGLIPMAVNVSYSMSKHAVVGLSMALLGQARRLGVHVSVLCPGFIETPMTQDGGKFGRLDRQAFEDIQKYVDSPPMMKADDFAERSLHKIARKTPIIVLPTSLRFLWLLYRLFPNFSLWLFEKGRNNLLKKMTDGKKRDGVL